MIIAEMIVQLQELQDELGSDVPVVVRQYSDGEDLLYNVTPSYNVIEDAVVIEAMFRFRG